MPEGQVSPLPPGIAVALGMVVALVAGGLSGFVHASATNAVLHDPYQPSPAMAAFGPLALGAIVGLVALPLFAGMLSWLLLRRSATWAVIGWLAFVGVGGAAWMAAFSMTP